MQRETRATEKNKIAIQQKQSENVENKEISRGKERIP